MTSSSLDRRVGWSRFYVPDPSFGWYIRGVALGALVAVLLFGGLLWWYHGRLLDVLGLYDRIAEPGMREVVVRYAQLSLLVTAVSVTGAAVWIIMLSAFFLHRIAGPIYRLKFHMMEMIAGNTPKDLAFRKKDQLKDLSVIFNEFVHHFGLLEGSGVRKDGTQQPIHKHASPRT